MKTNCEHAQMLESKRHHLKLALTKMQSELEALDAAIAALQRPPMGGLTLDEIRDYLRGAL